MTAIAFNLLGLALQLLIAAQQPNVPTDVKIQAVQTATYAIEYAQGIMPEPLNDNLTTEDILGSTDQHEDNLSVEEKAVEASSNDYGASYEATDTPPVMPSPKEGTTFN